MSFDLLAPYYRAMEAVLAGSVLHQCRTAFLAQAAQARQVLLLGEGPARYLVEVLRVNPAADIVCLDASAQMLAVAQRQLRRRGLGAGRVEFVCADVHGWSGGRERFDLVATHFFLDCFRDDQIARLVPRVAAMARPDARWILSDFQVPAAGWRRWLARAVLKAAYLFFRLATRLPASRLVPADPYLAASGFHLAERRVLYHGLLHADLWARGSASLLAGT